MTVGICIRGPSGVNLPFLPRHMVEAGRPVKPAFTPGIIDDVYFNCPAATLFTKRRQSASQSKDGVSSS
jgi:hypothetical protein